MKKKVIKAKLGMGIIGVAADAFKNSQTVRDIGGNLGLLLNFYLINITKKRKKKKNN
jgi:hypothetical protein